MFLEIQRAVDDEAEEERIDDSGDRSFGRRKHAGENAADDDDRREERQRGVGKRAEESAELEARVARIVPPPRVPGDHHHQHRRHQEARHDAGRKELPDRGIGDHAVDDERQRRGNDRADGGRGGGDADGEVGVVAGVAHRLDFDVAEPTGVGDRSARHAGEDDARADIHMAEPAVHPPDRRARETEDACRDAGGVHQVSGENEERHGDQREGVDAVHHVVEHRHRRQPGEHDEDERREPERDRDRRTDHHQNEEQDKEKEERHRATRPSPSSRGVSIAATTSRPRWRILRTSQSAE